MARIRISKVLNVKYKNNLIKSLFFLRAENSKKFNSFSYIYLWIIDMRAEEFDRLHNIKYFGEKNSILTENQFPVNIDHCMQAQDDPSLARNIFKMIEFYYTKYPCILDWFHAPKICLENKLNCESCSVIRYSALDQISSRQKHMQAHNLHIHSHIAFIWVASHFMQGRPWSQFPSLWLGSFQKSFFLICWNYPSFLLWFPVSLITIYYICSVHF